MNQPRRLPKKPYTAPRLRCYGDLRKLTGGGTRSKDETNTVTGPKTRPIGAA